MQQFDSKKHLVRLPTCRTSMVAVIVSIDLCMRRTAAAAAVPIYITLVQFRHF